MNSRINEKRFGDNLRLGPGTFILWALSIVGLLASGSADALTLNVQDSSGTPLAVEFRWMLEEDNTTLTVPGVATNDSISLVIHKSHAPVAATNSSASSPATITVPDPTKRYLVSVMADGYALGGAPLAPGQTNVTVILNTHPLPTAQISVFVFNDNNSINNAPDATEEGLPGFKIVLADFAGGPIMADVFGNPLGTTYTTNGAGDFITDINGDYVVDQMGSGEIFTDANGKALIKFIAMGKYGVQAIPPTASDWVGAHGAAHAAGAWHQTATIEGTLTVDAWVAANEPPAFMEGFGPSFYHAFFGFVDPAQTLWATNAPEALPENMTITGVNIFNHFGRPPNNQMFAPGPAVSEAWVGLNEIGPLNAIGRGLYVAPCNADGSFTITNVPPGTYQLVTWDAPLDALFGFNTIVVSNVAGGVQDLGDILSYRWFGTLEGNVFYDEDQDGFRDPMEQGIPQMAVNIRWRDGTIYMATTTDGMGEYAMSEVFPFFKWLVVEVDFSRFKATGMTSITDDGGFIPVDDGWNMPSDGVRTPQPQFETDPVTGEAILSSPVINPNTGNNLSRTEIGPVLTEAFHLFLNQNNRIDWGKVNYTNTENGGISGIAFHSVTRAEEDPRDAVGDAWESGIPRVQVVLYSDTNYDKIIDDLDDDGEVTLADVDNYPLGWTNAATKGPEDVDYNSNLAFDPGDAIQITWSDSWDDSIEESPTLGAIQTNPAVVLGKPIIGSDNYGTWNQIQPGVFDGGYAFGSHFPGGIASGSTEVEGLPTGMYIVHAVPPPGYLIQTEESMNVAFGDAYQPSKLWLPPECVGTTNNGAPLHIVPDYLTLFPGQMIPAPFAGQARPLADRKWVMVSNGKNAAADFHMYTEIPKGTRVVGFVLNDLTAEFNAFSPIFGEKGSPGWLPISIRDWAGHEVAHVYCDEYGTYNALVPSTYTVNVPSPSGVAPNMLTIILNDPTMADPTDPTGQRRIPDPHYNPNFSTTPWTLHYFPGMFLYADTPIVPIAGFVGYPNKQLDVEPADLTPVIHSVSNATDGVAGPYVNNDDDVIVITAMGMTSVPNTNLLFGTTNTILRDYGFGTVEGTVTMDGVALNILSWTTNAIQVDLTGSGIPLDSSGRLMVTRGDNGLTTPIGVTLTYGAGGSTVYQVVPREATLMDPFPDPIQEAIDGAEAGDLILVAPGIYNENPILSKPLFVQGAGAGTILNANPNPAGRIQLWHNKVNSLLGFDPFAASENAGFTVFGTNATDFSETAARIDGFRIVGSIAGGGMQVLNFAHNLRISNNRIDGNQGTYCGGITLGMLDNAGTLYDNTNVTVESNQILKNGGVNGAGGVAIYNGSTGYRILDNDIIGNFSRGNGGGIGHQGVSPGGLIANNVIRNNEVFFGILVGGDGGGIFVGGEPVVAGGGASSGSGSVTIYNNLIQGNLAGSGNGGGVCIAAVNGADVEESGDAADWYLITLLNNMIVNNVAGLAGGGISLTDAARVRIIHNTIANNDSVATSKSAFEVGELSSTPQGAGIVSYPHSEALESASGQFFSNPELRNNIIWQNRSFYYDSVAQSLVPAPGVFYRDLQTPEGQPRMNPRNCILSSVSGYHFSNIAQNPEFVSAYSNTLLTAAVIDEAGNNISVRFEETGAQGDYHIMSGSPAVDLASSISGVSGLDLDYDWQVRPSGGSPDSGADEYSVDAPSAPVLPTVPVIGPLPTGTPPAGGGGANTPPGTPEPPLFQAIPVDTDGVDTDGDGNVSNDYVYIHLAAGDGFARMADSNELYTFGFSDATADTLAMAEMGHYHDILPMVMMNNMMKAECSSPTLVMKEGQRVYLDLTNVGMMMRPDLFDPHTVHFHGFPNAAPIFDGEPMASISINMGATLRYYYEIVEPGTFLYHCHVEATEHMEMGMLGNLYVLPKQNNLPDGYPFANGFVHQAGYQYAYNDGDGSTRYDVDYPLQLTAFDRSFHELHIAVQPLPFWSLDESYPMINGRGYPDTINTNPIYNASSDNYSQKVHALIEADQGQRILLRISNLSLSDFHTLTVLGIPMQVVGKDARLLRSSSGVNLYQDTTSVTLGGGEAADVILDTAGVAPGTYFVYDARLNHLSNDQEDFGGMMTEIIIK